MCREGLSCIRDFRVCHASEIFVDQFWNAKHLIITFNFNFINCDCVKKKHIKVFTSICCIACKSHWENNSGLNISKLYSQSSDKWSLHVCWCTIHLYWQVTRALENFEVEERPMFEFKAECPSVTVILTTASSLDAKQKVNNCVWNTLSIKVMV